MSKKNKLPTKAIYLIGLFCILSISIALASVLDFFGPPPPGDPSAFRALFITEDPLGLPPANEGAFEGGLTGTLADAGTNNSVPESELVLLAEFDVPTGGQASPLFGATDFSQQMLRFEEFGTEPLPGSATPGISFPVPSLGSYPEQDPVAVAASGPAGADLEAFLAQPGISPLPSEYANDFDENPWKLEIEDYLGRELDTPPAEGRPPGRAWAHQRWNEFFPEVFFKTAQAGARVNGGFRDNRQLHGYSVGEFAPGGLYHNTAGVPATAGTTAGVTIRFHPDMPVQDHKTLWTFDGTLPPKLLMTRYGQSVLVRHYNALPIDPAANRGFGLHTLTTHEHNGHNPAESDGYTNAFFFPGQYYDYRWPMTLAGYDTVNTTAADPRAAFPCSDGETLFVNDLGMDRKTCQDGTIQIRGDWKETMSTHWFHDHMLDFTAQNVYKGNAAMMNYYSALDRGNEALDDGVNLRFPSGTALDWGNRDYDVNLLIADKAWDQEGQLWFNIFNLDGFIGDRVLTNWQYKPYFEVRARSYRFRILNGSVSRYFAFALVQQVEGGGGELPGPPGSGVSYNRVPFHMIANDGNIMEHTVPFDGSVDLDNDGALLDHKGQLPTQAIAERYDIIVDFSKHGIEPGDRLYLVNVLEHSEGRKTKDKIPLAEILSGEYLPTISDGHWVAGDPAIGKILELRVAPYAGNDLSMDPEDYLPGKQKMIPLPLDRSDPQLANALHRTFEFGQTNATDEAPWTIKTDGGKGFAMDPRRVTAAPTLATGPTMAGFDGTNAAGDDQFGTLEIWRIENSSGSSHPVHIHFEEGVILKRNGFDPPEWERWARKDLYRIGPEEDSGDSVEVALRFREFAGTYMEHCHNTQHEDHSMLMRWDIEHPGQIELMAAPIPTWDGVEYVDSAALPTFRTGDGIGPTPPDVTLTETPGPTAGAFDYTAVASDGAAPFEYRFFLRSPGETFVDQTNWSTDSVWTWNTAGLAGGNYIIQVRARSQGSAEIVLNTVTHTIATPSATAVSLTETAGAIAGTFDYTALASGGQAPYQYRFFLRSPGGTFVAQTGWPTDSVWTWNTAGLAGGNYIIQVRARSQGSAEIVLNTVTHTIAPPPATAVSLTETAGAIAGTFDYTALASGGQAPYQYRFFLRAPGETFVDQTGWSTDSVWTWNTAGLAGGNYIIQVRARSQGSAEIVLNTVTHTIAPPPATAVSLTETAGAIAGAFDYTALASGGQAPYEYRFFLRAPGGTFVAQTGWSTDSVWTWNTAGLAGGNYIVRVHARSQGSVEFAEVVANTITHTIP